MGRGREGAGIRPRRDERGRPIYGLRDDLTLVDHAETALEGADALAILTEWQEFRSPDFDTIRDKLSAGRSSMAATCTTRRW